MILKKKYRLWWDENKIIQNEHKEDYTNSVTHCGHQGYYESDNYADIEAKIKSEKLTTKVEEQ